MSTKTIKQRIALVAVTALSAGFISVVSVPAANAVIGDYDSNVAVAGATTNPKLAKSEVLYIASLPSVTGSAVALATSAVAVGGAGVGPETNGARSLGLINVSDIAAGLTAGTTTTAVMLSTGRLSVYTQSASSTWGAITVTGGTITSSTGTAINSTLTVAAGGTTSAVNNWGAVIAPASGATSMVVRLYSGATAEATAIAGPTLGTLTGQITVTLASASVAGAISPLTSGVFGAVDNNTAGITADAAYESNNTGYNATRPYGSSIFLAIRARDAYGTAINTGSNGILQVTATNGAIVGLAASSVGAGTTSTAFLATATPDQDLIRVDAPGSAPVSTTVTVTFNGTVIGTKALSFTGEVAKIELSAPVVGKTGTNVGNTATYKLFDAANNALYTTRATVAQAVYPVSSLLGDAALVTSTVSAVTRDTTSAITSAGVITNGTVLFTCGSTAGTGKAGVTYTNPSGTIVKSNALDVRCAGDALSYSASWDKASYIPGDIAKLTVSFLDSKGNGANDVGTITTTGTASSIPVVSIGGLDKTITGPTTGDVLDGSKITYTYTVGATIGTFTGSVLFPDVDTRMSAAAGASAVKAVTATLVVKESTASVSNADVLKSIVALIASINKQIQALQKLILRR
jgi:hypothetical protein